MAALNCRCVSAIVLMVCAYAFGVYGRYDTLYMEDYCRADSSTLRYLGTTKGALIYSQRGLKYENNLDCSLTLYTASTGWILYLKSEMIQLEESLDCISVSDGNQPTSFTQHCANAIEFTTTQKYLTINMTTDGSVTRTGFRLVVTPIDQGSFCSTGFNFRCDNGDCIHDDFKLDGHQNCLDNSDETGFITTVTPGLRPACTSGYGDYQCTDGYLCYSDYNTCDGSISCSLNEDDEKNCDGCKDSEDFYCATSRRCVSSYRVCDDIRDCEYGEDEDDETCYSSIYLYWTPGQLAGLFMGYILFVSIVIGIVVAVNKKCK